jgi:hypothetical protein
MVSRSEVYLHAHELLDKNLPIKDYRLHRRLRLATCIASVPTHCGIVAIPNNGIHGQAHSQYNAQAWVRRSRTYVRCCRPKPKTPFFAVSSLCLGSRVARRLHTPLAALHTAGVAAVHRARTAMYVSQPRYKYARDLSRMHATTTTHRFSFSTGVYRVRCLASVVHT